MKHHVVVMLACAFALLSLFAQASMDAPRHAPDQGAFAKFDFTAYAPARDPRWVKGPETFDRDADEEEDPDWDER